MNTLDNLKAKAVKGAGINVIIQFLGLITNTVSVIILARLLTPKDFGLVAMVTAFSIWLMNFGENGFAEYIIQKREISKEEVNSIFWLHVLISSVFAVGFSLFGICLVNFYSEPSLLGISVAMAISFILIAFTTSPLAMLKKEMKFKPIAFVRLTAAVLSVSFAIAAALIGMSYWAIVIRQLTALVVVMVGAWVLCPWRPKRPQIIKALEGFKYSLKVYANFSLSYAMRNIDKVLLGKFYGSEILGNYDRGYQLSMIPLNNLLTPLHNVALATLSRLKEDEKQFISYYSKAVGMVSFLGTAAALVLTLSANDIIYLLLGPEWSGTGSVVMAFGPGIAAMFIYGTHSWLHLSLGTPGRWLRWNIFSTIFTVTVFVIAARYGAVAMAIAYSATAYILVVPAIWYGGYPIGLELKSVISSLWANFASAILIFALWIIASKYWLELIEHSGNLILLFKISTVSIVALFLYLVLVVLFQRSFQSIRDISTFVKIFVGKSKDKS